MGYHFIHRYGSFEKDPPLERLKDLYAELDADDREHTDVAVSHESGWTLSAFSDGTLLWENVERDGHARHLKGTRRDQVIDLWTKLATGDTAAIDREDWLNGYP